MDAASSLKDLGWSRFFEEQLIDREVEGLQPARVLAVHRDRVALAGVGFDELFATTPPVLRTGEEQPTVGDWVLVDVDSHRVCALLDRRSLFKRRAPGSAQQLQLIAANIDTVFIVSSCNQDFNIARLERYLVMAREANVFPVIVLTKADLCAAPEDYMKLAARLQAGLLVEAVNALDLASRDRLSPFCGPGQTVAFLGSSGVGKSTLVNTLTGDDSLVTQGIREDDAKGRHTTTGRSMHRLSDGGWLVDTPGMREIQLTDVSAGLQQVFSDIEALAAQCRYSDCTHTAEPGCAVLNAIDEAELDGERVARWRKLAAEEKRNTETLAQRRDRERGFSKMARTIIRGKRKNRAD